MKKISLILFFPFKGIAPDQFDPYELTLEQLGQIHIYTASRSLTTIEEASSIVIVFTAMVVKYGQKVKKVRVPLFIFLYRKRILRKIKIEVNMKKYIAIHSIIFKWKSKVFLNLKKISILFLFVISFLSMASAQTETDSLEALLPGLQGREKIEVFEQLIELNTNQAPGKAIEFGRQALELLEHFKDTKMKIYV